MILHVTEARHLDGYRVRLAFNNGRTGIADLSPALHGPMFEALKDPAEFSRFQVDKELETIAWPNGADLAPEYVYYLAFGEDPELRDQFREWGYAT